MIPFANRQLDCHKAIKNGRTVDYALEVSFSFSANVQQSSLEDLAMGLNPNPTDRTFSIYCDTTGNIEVGDKLVDQDSNEFWIVSGLKRFINQGGFDYILVLGVAHV